ncbi:FAD-dependent oxidoreductase [Actinokineospora soli]|uniref:FAD-dependent oxidoreductase n=1 Tax=Actinokineospora soli TaxID=1048753 RepID=A0ABW2TTT1_9PSEU
MRERFAACYELPAFSLHRAAGVLTEQLARLDQWHVTVADAGDFCHQVEELLRCAAPILVDLAARAGAEPGLPTGGPAEIQARVLRGWPWRWPDMAAQRVLVVGAGVTGLLTAVRCAAAGHRVVVLDRGPVPNPAATSFDQHRALRALHVDDPATTAAAATARRRWSVLEGELGERFRRPVGVVTAVPADAVARSLALAADAGVGLSVPAPGAFAPVAFPDHGVALFEPDGGVLLAERVLRAAVRWLSHHPLVELRPWQPVVDVDTAAPAVTTARGERLRGDVLLVAAGPWSRALVDVPTTLYRQTVVYLRPPEDLADWWETAPCVGGAGPDGRSWLVPPGAGTDLKTSTAAACRAVGSLDDPDDPDHWADVVLRAGALADPDRYRVVAARTCHYAVDAATGAGALTRVGPAAWARAASGGDGFRTAPLVADHIADALAAVPA